MARLVKVLGIAVLLVAGIAAATEMTTTTGTFRYKMTVEVETPEGLKTGSAVREVNVVIAHPDIQGMNGTRAFVKGEAVVVDLGKRGVLFALLKGFKYSYDHDYQVVFEAFPGPPGLTEEGLNYYTHLKNAEATLTPDQYPLMVTFTDIKNPRTVKSVYNGVSDGQFPAHYTFDDRFEEAFGKGIYLKNIKIHMTEDPIISAIENRLLWLSDWAKRGGSISGEIIFNTPPPLEKTLIYRDFLRK